MQFRNKARIGPKQLQFGHETFVMINKSRVPSANFVGLNILYREYSADIFYAVFYNIRDFFILHCWRRGPACFGWFVRLQTAAAVD